MVTEAQDTKCWILTALTTRKKICCNLVQFQMYIPTALYLCRFLF